MNTRFVIVLLTIVLSDEVHGFKIAINSTIYHSNTAPYASTALSPLIIVPLNGSSVTVTTGKQDSANPDKEGNNTVCNKKHDHAKQDGHFDKTELESGNCSIRIAAVPLIILIVFVIIACSVANRSTCTIIEQFPILAKLCPFQIQPIRDNNNNNARPLNCVHKICGNHLPFVHFMKALTNPLAPAPEIPCSCDCRRCAKKKHPPRASSSSSSDSSSPVSSPKANLSPTVSFKNGDEQVEIRGLSSSESQQSESAGTGSVTTSCFSSSSDDSDSSSGRMTKKERKAFNQERLDDDDSSSATDINPFDPEYVYAALAPDMQHPSYDNFVEEMEAISGIITSPSSRNHHQQVIFRQPITLETIRE